MYAYEVLLFVPNLICYLRLALLLAAEALLLCGPWPWAALACHVANLCLDAVDGMAARKLHQARVAHAKWQRARTPAHSSPPPCLYGCIQATAFGAFLDVVVDNLSRAALWGRALPGLVGALVPALESVTFACTHQVRALSEKGPSIPIISRVLSCLSLEQVQWAWLALRPSPWVPIPVAPLMGSAESHISPSPLLPPFLGWLGGMEAVRLLLERTVVGAGRHGGQFPDASRGASGGWTHGHTVVVLGAEVSWFQMGVWCGRGSGGAGVFVLRWRCQGYRAPHNGSGYGGWLGRCEWWRGTCGWA